jgi:adenine-specific DNA methylase/DNA-binding Xre family transcriptional regulator
MKKCLIEKWLPIRELSRDAAIEMSYKPTPAYIAHSRELNFPVKGRSFYDPKIRNLHPWFARRPCSVARAITLAAALADNVGQDTFMRILGWKNQVKAFHNGYAPILFFADPDRLQIMGLVQKALKGKKFFVCDPMAGGGSIPFESVRMGFQTIAYEYNPVAYLVLKGTVEFPAKYGLSLAQQVREEAKNLIKYMELKTGPFYALDAEGYIIARGINCPSCKGPIPLIHDAFVGGKTYLKPNFDVDAKTFQFELVHEPTELDYMGREITCPYCRKTINKKEAYKLWSYQHKELLREILRGHVDLHNLLRTHILLVKQKSKGYTLCTEEDKNRFIKAAECLAEKRDELLPYIPSQEIPKENEVFEPIRDYGIQFWHELFNPRQLLVLATMVKYVNERCKELSTHGEPAVAIALYLAFGLSRVIDFNSTATTWNSRRQSIRDTIGHYSQARKISYGEEYCEAIVPFRNLQWVFEANESKPKKTRGGICPTLNEFCRRLNGLGDRALVSFVDSRELSSFTGIGKLHVINVDPPYFDQHLYSDISEYFWQVLYLAIRPIIENGYFFQDTAHWRPSYIVPREGEIIVKKGKDARWYEEQMTKFFRECKKSLKDDGIFIVWFTHRSWEAWESILSALYTSGFYVTKVWPIFSEHPTRLVRKREGFTLDRTMIMIVRKKETIGALSKPEEYLSYFVKSTKNILKEVQAAEHEQFMLPLAAAACAVTIAPCESERADEYFKSTLIPFALFEGSKALIVSLLEGHGIERERILSEIEKLDQTTRLYLALLALTKYVKERAVPRNILEKICKAYNIAVSELLSSRVIKRVGKNYQVTPPPEHPKIREIGHQMEDLQHIKKQNLLLVILPVLMTDQELSQFNIPLSFQLNFFSPHNKYQLG